MKTHWLDLVVLAIYFISMAWLGIYFSKRNKDTEQYFVGGRSFGGFTYWYKESKADESVPDIRATATVIS